MKIIKERQYKIHKEFRRDFTIVGEEQGNGYSFPCLPGGFPDINDENCEYWIKHFEYCINHPEEYIDEGVVVAEWNYEEPAIGLCSCGNEVELTDEYLGACQCNKCGQWYNIFGQKLIDPEFWETN